MVYESPKELEDALELLRIYREKKEMLRKERASLEKKLKDYCRKCKSKCTDSCLVKNSLETLMGL